MLEDPGSELDRPTLLLSHEPCRVDEQEARFPHRAQVALGVDHLPGGGGVDPVDPVEAERFHQLDLLLQPLDVARCRRYPEEAGADLGAVEPVLVDEVLQLVHAALHVGVGPTQEILTPQQRCRAEPEADHCHGERPVAAARPVADGLGFEHRHSHRRVLALQVDGGGEPG